MFNWRYFSAQESCSEVTETWQTVRYRGSVDVRVAAWLLPRSGVCPPRAADRSLPRAGEGHTAPHQIREARVSFWNRDTRIVWSGIPSAIWLCKVERFFTAKLKMSRKGCWKCPDLWKFSKGSTQAISSRCVHLVLSRRSALPCDRNYRILSTQQININFFFSRAKSTRIILR